ncbi:MAG: hypothetical protein JETT_3692 [Candidatus Jettenia ecosi]|uniref:Uncharacterized protein n=1 Tax=Candidatus Jettenia ecosi TaxID=2494326 RepID=A0A533Q636_9BACT|nr:MAG: hypothetical protein JETT_3692 [Candidatus Jettenia ecosi]
MNIRWISHIVFLVTFLVMSGVVYGEEDQPCQPGVVVFFGNGVWNDVENAKASTFLLTDRLETHISGTNLDGIITYKLAHNPSEGALEDLLETFEQEAQTDYSKLWNYLAGLDIMPDYLQDKLKEIANRVNAAIVSANPSVQEHIGQYNTYLGEGRKVVLVAHSQGNLYGNIAYLGIDPQYLDRFGIVSVANPDDYVAGGGPYTTIKEDLIIGSLPTALDSNVNNFSNTYINPFDLSGHSFIKSYMFSGHDAEKQILEDVVNTVDKLSSSYEITEIVNTYNILKVVCGNPGTTLVTIPQDVYITEISTYHWCDGGQPAGTHSLYNLNSFLMYGPFSATIDFRFWLSYPNTYVPAGGYEVIDSEPSTWSHTYSGGFVRIRGILCY